MFKNLVLCIKINTSLNLCDWKREKQQFGWRYFDIHNFIQKKILKSTGVFHKRANQALNQVFVLKQFG